VVLADFVDPEPLGEALDLLLDVFLLFDFDMIASLFLHF
jgi:hypothetical protein